MRTLAAICSAVAVLLPMGLSAQLQTQSQDQGATTLKMKGVRDYSGLTEADRLAYCFWAGELYSVGASFCYRQTSIATCTENPGKRPYWVTKDNDNLCAKNPSLTPQ